MHFLDTFLICYVPRIFFIFYFLNRALPPFPPTWWKGFSLWLLWILNNSISVSCLTWRFSLFRPWWMGSESPLYQIVAKRDIKVTHSPFILFVSADSFKGYPPLFTCSLHFPCFYHFSTSICFWSFMLKCYSSDISNPSFAIAFHPNKTDLLFFYEEEKTIKLLFKREKNISVNFTAYHCWTFPVEFIVPLGKNYLLKQHHF